MTAAASEIARLRKLVAKRARHWPKTLDLERLLRELDGLATDVYALACADQRERDAQIADDYYNGNDVDPGDATFGIAARIRTGGALPPEPEAR